jgi:hypothetical protein
LIGNDLIGGSGLPNLEKCYSVPVYLNNLAGLSGCLENG